MFGRCRHDLVLMCGGDIDYAYCKKCNLRTPCQPHDNFAWVKTMFKDAQKNGTLFKMEVWIVQE
ncbi:hypothetical protein LCGC14_1646700 [marine sediment metagenome]|uniref:Uncharacterized protein n=1 Tax=marine sediment metagenome TaxID=412755 RepID=A0A0F9KXX9_9ZZZZ